MLRFKIERKNTIQYGVLLVGVGEQGSGTGLEVGGLKEEGRFRLEEDESPLECTRSGSSCCRSVEDGKLTGRRSIGRGLRECGV